MVLQERTHLVAPADRREDERNHSEQRGGRHLDRDDELGVRADNRLF